MRKLLITTAIISLSASAANGAASGKFQETITLPPSSAVKINVTLSEDMSHRAENLPKALRDRSSARNRNDGFGGNGHYGQKELVRLQEKLSGKLGAAFDKSGVLVSDTAPYTLNITIADARPNRPTLRQMSKSPSLSFQSRALGGAELTGELVDASGQILGTVSYAWYENSLRDSYGFRTWGDAERTFSRFATQTAKSISD